MNFSFTLRYRLTYSFLLTFILFVACFSLSAIYQPSSGQQSDISVQSEAPRSPVSEQPTPSSPKSAQKFITPSYSFSDFLETILDLSSRYLAFYPTSFLLFFISFSLFAYFFKK